VRNVMERQVRKKIHRESHSTPVIIEHGRALEEEVLRGKAVMPFLKNKTRYKAEKKPEGRI